jgi:RNA polymerase sigma factor (sigma-70 family)
MSLIPNHENNGEETNSLQLEKKHTKRVLAELNFRPGNHADFTLAFNVFYKQLCYFSNRLLNDWHYAEDIVIDVFIKFWNQKGDFKGTGSIKRWLYKCTYNESLRRIQGIKNKPVTDIDLVSNRLWDYQNQLSKMTKDEQHTEICSLVDMLPPQCKSIIKLYYFLELDNRQIAALFDISVHTVKNQKARGIYLMKKRMNPMLFGN